MIWIRLTEAQLKTFNAMADEATRNADSDARDCVTAGARQRAEGASRRYGKLYDSVNRQAKENKPLAILEALQNLEDCARLVVERWTGGDLDDAVNSLRVDAENARAAIKAVRP